MMVVIYLHGAHSTNLSFAYFKTKLPNHNYINFAYNTNDSIIKTVANFKILVDSQVEPINIISHSLGGLIAVMGANNCPKIEKIVTMGSPFGGSNVASLLRWFMPIILFQEIHTGSSIIKNLKCPQACIKSFVTQDGSNPFIREPNDGIVTVRSQKALVGPEYIDMNLNHFEILLCDNVIGIIKDFIF